MPAFDYTAKTESGETLTGSLVVANLDQLEKVINQRGLLLIEAKEQTAVSGIFERFYGSVDDTLLFTVQMATGLPSGLPIIEVIDDMIEELPPGHFKRVLQDVKINLEAGNNLSDSLALYPNYFNDIYRVIVRTGEQSGQLDVIFQDLVELLEWERDLRKQVKKALRYPLGMLGMLTGLVVLVLTVVIPNFSQLFAMGGRELPLPTRILLGMGNFFENYWLPVIVSLIALFITYKFISSSEQGKRQIDRIKFQVPIFGTLLKKISLSRFAHFWQLLFASGVDLAKTLEIVSEVVQNREMQASIMEARASIINGQPMTEAFRQTNMFPGLVLRMINLGETTGAMENSLGKVAEYYDKEIPEAIESALAAFQPIMMMVMAGLLLIVAMAIMLPMFSMIEAVA